MRCFRGCLKKDCKKRAAEIHDEALFKELPEREECPLCFLPRPIKPSEQAYFSCCGKIICAGCTFTSYTTDSRRLCPYCRGRQRISEREAIERLKKRAEVDDAVAINYLGCFYHVGSMGLPQNFNKAIELWLRAGELGQAAAHHNIGVSYENGEVVERDMMKAKFTMSLLL